MTHFNKKWYKIFQIHQTKFISRIYFRNNLISIHITKSKLNTNSRRLQMNQSNKFNNPFKAMKSLKLRSNKIFMNKAQIRHLNFKNFYFRKKDKLNRSVRTLIKMRSLRHHFSPCPIKSCPKYQCKIFYVLFRWSYTISRKWLLVNWICLFQKFIFMSCTIRMVLFKSMTKWNCMR